MTIATLPRQTKRQRAGIALLEAIIAIGVLLAGVVGSLVLINTTISLGRANQDRVVAQNLAREGLEIAYSLRNSAALAKVEDQGVTWDQFLFSPILKITNKQFYLDNFDLGLNLWPPGTPTTIPGFDSKCAQRCDAAVSDHCVQDAADPEPDTSDANLEDPGNIRCDIIALVDFLIAENPHTPPVCDQVLPNIARFTPLDTDPKNTWGCDYTGDHRVDIADLSLLIADLYLASYHLTAGYPNVAVQATPTRQLQFERPAIAGDTINLQTEVWDKPDARVYDSNGTYSQVTTAGTESKFYRVVSIQAVCRGNYDPDDAGPLPIEVREIIVPQNSLLNCRDYTRTQAHWISTSVSKVGGLVTSEVRWPKPSSSTKVKYQEFLYDWINA